MRLYDLRLSPFGNFDDLTVPFRPGTVHVVYGPNEAGKSTCHAALVGHFFGWSKAKKDSLQVAHMHGALARVAARWKPREGADEVRATRLGQKVVDDRGNDLVEGSYEARFAPFGKADFETFFALDHGSLRDGGTLLGDKSGGLRDALFAAARSGDDIRRVHAALVQEEEELFRPRARVLPVNRAILAMKTATERARDLSSLPEKWEHQARDVRAATAARETLSAEHLEVSRDLQRLGTIRKLLECVSTLKRVDADLALLAPPLAYPETVEPATARERIARLDETARSAEARATAAAAQLEVLRGQLVSTREEAAFAAHADAAKEAASAALELARLLESSPAAVAEPLAEPPDEDRLQPLEEALQLLERSTERATRIAAERLQHETDLARLARVALPSPSAAELRALERRAGEHEGAADRTAQAKAAHEHARSELDARAGFDEALDILVGLPLPTREESRAMVVHLRELDVDATRSEQELHRTREQLTTLEHELEQLQRRAPMPREDQLLALRETRDHLAERAQRGEPTPALLPAIREADAMVDAMRLAADRIAERIAKEDELDRTGRRHEQLHAEAEASRARAATARSALEVRLAGLPGPARSALELESWSVLRESAQKLRIEADELARLEAQHAERAPAATAAEYASLAERAEATERSHGLIGARHTELTTTLARVGDDHDRTVLELARAVDLVRQRGEALGRTELAPEALSQWIRSARAERSTWERARAKNEEHARVQRLVVERQQLLRDRLPRLGFAVSAEDALLQPPEAVAAAIDARVHAAMRADERAKALDREALAAETSLRVAQAEADTARGELATWLAAVGAADASEAERTLRVESARLELRAQRAAEQALAARIAAPAAVEPLLAEAASHEADALDRLMAEKKARLAEIDVALEQARSEETSRKLGLEQMSRADHTASLALFEAEEARAEAVALAARWTVARLGVTLLNRALERYRQEHQDPVLARASEAFAALTRGRYRRVVPELGDGKEKLRLAVERHDGVLQPAAVLSEGTRDQLFLAMRFGTLEARAEEGTLPLPIVLDDIFVNFDDQRTEAGLARLAALVPLTDVVYFTHHERVVELATQALPPELLDVVRLPGPPLSE